MVNAVYDHIVALLVVGAIFVSAIVVLPSISFVGLQTVDQQQLRNTALNVFNTMLLDTGQPVNWGALRNFQHNDPRVTRFGLASARYSTFYTLDPDKVQRLVVGNPLNYTDYNTVRNLLGLQDYGFKLRIVPPFNVTFMGIHAAGTILDYSVKVVYLDGKPIPNAKVAATAVYSKGKDNFNVSQGLFAYTDSLGFCNGVVPLGFSDPDYFMVTLRVTVADVATLVVNSGQVFNNTIAKVNMVYDDLILTTTKLPPNYNQPPNEQVWIYDIVAFDSQGQLWWLMDEGSKSTDKFNTGEGSWTLWIRNFFGLHDFQPVVLIFNFWAIDPVTGQGRQQVMVVMAYPEILGTGVFEYGGTAAGASTADVQRSVLISGMTYTAELLLWKESP